MKSLLERAMEATTQEEADAIFESLVKAGQLSGQTRKRAEKIQRHNLGYFSGYYSSEVQLRVEKLYKTHHPFLGPVGDGSSRTPDNCLKVGMEMGKKLRKR